MADALRNNMDAAEYKHVVLGLIFLKYISDAFEEKHAEARGAKSHGADPGRSATNTAPPASSGCRRRRAGRISRRTRQAADHRQDWSTRRWSRSSATTRRSRACCPRTTPAPASTSTPRRADRPGQQHRARRRGRTASKDIAGPRLRIFPRAVRQRRRQEGRPVLHAVAASCACWSRCSPRTRAASTIRAAAPAACSCSSEKFVEAHGGKHRRHLHLRPGVATTPRGGWPR